MPKPIRGTIQKIIFECQESGATKWEAMKVLKELEKTAGNEKQLRKIASETLELLNPEAAKTFQSFEKLKVFTSKERREAFDRGNIIKSLIKETKVSRAVAEKIGSEVEDKIKDLKIDYLNTQLIREMVSVKLLDYGHEPIHQQYARLGMPVFEVTKKIENCFFENSEILKEYNWMIKIPKNARELHFDSLIHIFSSEDFSTKLFSYVKFFDGKPEDIAVQIKRKEKYYSCPVSIKAINFSCAEEKNSPKKTKEISETMDKVLGLVKTENAELALFSDFEWEKKSRKKKNAIELANEIISNKKNNLKYHISVDTKYQLKLIDEKYDNKNYLILDNSKDKVTMHSFGVILGADSSILQAVALNLDKISETIENENALSERITEICDSIKELENSKKTELAKRNYFNDDEIKKSKSVVCLAGIWRICSKLNEKNPYKIAENIILDIRKNDFLVTECPAKTAINRFGLIKENKLTNQMLLEMNPKIRKNYGFIYSAENEKEADKIFGNVHALRFTHQDYNFLQ